MGYNKTEPSRGKQIRDQRFSRRSFNVFRTKPCVGRFQSLGSISGSARDQHPYQGLVRPFQPRGLTGVETTSSGVIPFFSRE